MRNPFFFQCASRCKARSRVSGLLLAFIRWNPRLEENAMPYQQFQACLTACNACAIACDRCAAACLQENDVKALARCIALDIDCAALCRVAADAVARNSEMARRICEACAEECEHHDMDHCQACAAACRRCANECRKMAARRVRHGADQGALLQAH
jgi:hypothetical protein